MPAHMDKLMLHVIQAFRKDKRQISFDAMALQTIESITCYSHSMLCNNINKTTYTKQDKAQEKKYFDLKRIMQNFSRMGDFQQTNG